MGMPRPDEPPQAMADRLDPFRARIFEQFESAEAPARPIRATGLSQPVDNVRQLTDEAISRQRSA